MSREGTDCQCHERELTVSLSREGTDCRSVTIGNRLSREGTGYHEKELTVSMSREVTDCHCRERELTVTIGN